jgi:hypothetical protein
MNKLNKIIEFFKLKFNHNLNLITADFSESVSWPEKYYFNCERCNTNICAFVANYKNIKDLHPLLISYKEIKFITRKSCVGDNATHISNYDKIENILTCDEQNIKNLLE